MNYSIIKALAKGNKQNVDDLIALASDNDPFYIGKPRHVRMAKWFAELWERFGYTTGVHLRRVHYRIVTGSDAVTMPGEKTRRTRYVNTEHCWDYLAKAGKFA